MHVPFKSWGEWAAATPLSTLLLVKGSRIGPRNAAKTEKCVNLGPKLQYMDLCTPLCTQFCTAVENHVFGKLALYALLLNGNGLPPLGSSKIHTLLLPGWMTGLLTLLCRAVRRGLHADFTCFWPPPRLPGLHNPQIKEPNGLCSNKWMNLLFFSSLLSMEGAAPPWLGPLGWCR